MLPVQKPTRKTADPLIFAPTTSSRPLEAVEAARLRMDAAEEAHAAGMAPMSAIESALADYDFALYRRMQRDLEEEYAE
jgi:hypothetical protein